MDVGWCSREWGSMCLPDAAMRRVWTGRVVSHARDRNGRAIRPRRAKVTPVIGIGRVTNISERMEMTGRGATT